MSEPGRWDCLLFHSNKLANNPQLPAIAIDTSMNLDASQSLRWQPFVELYDLTVPTWVAVTTTTSRTLQG
eukprot:6262232-Amphidinium_carterae.1